MARWPPRLRPTMWARWFLPCVRTRLARSTATVESVNEMAWAVLGSWESTSAESKEVKEVVLWHGRAGTRRW